MARKARKAHPKFWHGHHSKKTSRRDHRIKRGVNIRKRKLLEKIKNYEDRFFTIRELAQQTVYW